MSGIRVRFVPCCYVEKSPRGAECALEPQSTTQNKHQHKQRHPLPHQDTHTTQTERAEDKDRGREREKQRGRGEGRGDTHHTTTTTLGYGNHSYPERGICRMACIATWPRHRRATMREGDMSPRPELCAGTTRRYERWICRMPLSCRYVIVDNSPACLSVSACEHV